jgi:hypothetical protein
LSIIEPKGKAITRSFRLDQEWDLTLSKIAEKQGLSISGMLEKIVKDYLLFYRWVEELESVIFSPNTIHTIIEALDEEKLREIGEKVAQTTFKESYLVRGDEMNLDTVTFQIKDQMGRYAHWFTVEEYDTDSHYFYIKNRLGEKWGIFVEAYLSSLIQNIAGIEVETERIGENILVRLMHS